jgi:hypothetical protein
VIGHAPASVREPDSLEESNYRVFKVFKQFIDQMFACADILVQRQSS